ncbi:GntR family transcriptional regulator [Variovorax sp. EL159]|uniref:GntR family transcriptional regulator n=1 Tax=Variovorax sp. EL159 TaxID=1566270 RepID=UPI00088A7D2A|nr:GntR family transcriptional regulator [Variovorax sp. EL159]SCX72516.1 DNA-binding transcriptional regulator, GntR family [Variovorax sp. EL159]
MTGALTQPIPGPRPEDSATTRLEKTLVREIASGKWPVGALLPSETELCEQTGLSRYAIRQVVGRLTRIGLVSKQQGIGTTVLRSTPAPSYVQTMGTFADLSQYARGTELVVTEKQQIAAEGQICELLSCAPGEKVLRLSGVRYLGDQERVAIAIVAIYVASRYSKLRGLTARPKTPVHSLIEQTYDVQITRVEQDIHGALIIGTNATTLDVADGSAGLFIVRRYYLNSELVEVTTGLHPAERFSYSMAFALSSSNSV